MDSLYSSPPYAYLPQQNTTVDSYHPSAGSIYRPSSTNNAFPMDNHHHHHHHGHDLDPYHHQGWSSPSNHHAYGSYYGSNVTNNNSNNLNTTINSPRPKITTNLWEDEGTLCYQVDAKGICVARRQDNDMVNGTKLLNVVGMSRGKRDGILKNEKGRVVVKVGAMHLKGVWIPFARATELAEKFKILDLLYPLFVDEPSIYICSSIGAAHHNNEVIPSPPVTNNKCNIIPSPLPFNHRSSITADDYHQPPSANTLPSWDNNRPYSLLNSSNNNQYDSPQQVLHRNNSNPDLTSDNSPVPRSVNYTSHQHHHHSDENDVYLLNTHHSNNNTFDYYNNSRPLHHHHNNRGSFSSASSHHSYLYPSLQQQHHHHHQEDDASKASSVATPTSYVDNNNNSIYTHAYGGRSLSQDHGSNTKSLYNQTTSLPYIKSSPYTNSTTITSLIDTSNNDTTATATNRSSAGSTTPSSWFSPETPTAVLFQQQVKEETEVSIGKKRKSSCTSIESGLKTLKKQQIVASPTMRATKELSIKEVEQP